MHTLRLLVAARLKRVVTRAYRTEINAKRNTRTYPSPRCSLSLRFSFSFASNLLSSHPRSNLFSFSSRSKLRPRKRAYYSPSSSICVLRVFLRFRCLYARTTRNANRASISFFDRAPVACHFWNVDEIAARISPIRRVAYDRSPRVGKMDVERWNWTSCYASIIKPLRRSEARRAASNARIILEIFEPRHPRRQLFLVLVKSPRTSIFVAKCPDICSMTSKSILSVCRLQFS